MESRVAAWLEDPMVPSHSSCPSIVIYVDYRINFVMY